MLNTKNTKHKRCPKCKKRRRWWKNKLSANKKVDKLWKKVDGSYVCYMCVKRLKEI